MAPKAHCFRHAVLKELYWRSSNDKLERGLLEDHYWTGCIRFVEASLMKGLNELNWRSLIEKREGALLKEHYWRGWRSFLEGVSMKGLKELIEGALLKGKICKQSSRLVCSTKRPNNQATDRPSQPTKQAMSSVGGWSVGRWLLGCLVGWLWLAWLCNTQCRLLNSRTQIRISPRTPLTLLFLSWWRNIVE